MGTTASGRLGERAVARAIEARGSHGAVSLVVALLVLARIVAFVLQQVFAATGQQDAFRVVGIVGGTVSTLVDVVVLFVVLLLFESMRRIDRESDRMQAFMDNVYRRGL
ncbi:MAG: hypothetical protein QOE90_435 [Thermoplasmata archaeon]|jgi:uncharacterized membrane protein|nr:hypothetical protein [Thermoplasmata archaeon]